MGNDWFVAEAATIHTRYGAGAQRWIGERLVALAAIGDHANFERWAQLAANFDDLLAQHAAQHPAAHRRPATSTWRSLGRWWRGEPALSH